MRPWRDPAVARTRLFRVRAGLVLLLCMFLGWQALVAGLARMLAEAGASTAALRFDPGSSLANRDLAFAAYEQGDRAAAARHARAALGNSPLDQQALTILALSGAPAHVSTLMNLSAALGWRDPLTQLWLAQAGIVKGDGTLFATRLDAFARQHAESAEVTPLLDNQIVDPAFRKAIVPRLALRPGWRGTYLGTFIDADPKVLAGREALLDELARTAAPASRAEMLQYTQRLLHFDLRAAAHRTWLRHVARREDWSGKLYDGGFRAVPPASEQFPYEWSIVDTMGGFAAVEGDDGAHALHVHNDGLAAGPLLSQLLLLSPGRYRLTVRADDRDQQSGNGQASGFGWSVSCADNRNLIATAGGGATAAAGSGDRAYYLVVPPGCAEQTISLSAVAGIMSDARDLWVEHARLDPA